MMGKSSIMKIFSGISNKKQTLESLLFAGALASILWSVYFSVITISIPYQIEFREGTAQVLTGFFLRGENPFILDSQPLAMNNYGIGYNLVVYPFVGVFGNTLMVHRSMTFLFVVLSAMLSWFVVYKGSRLFPLGLTCAAFVMVGLIGRGGIGAFPSALGTFLFLLAIFVPFLRSFDLAGLALSFVLSLMAFYTKPYFLLAFGIVCSYLVLFVSKKRGVLYGAFFLAGFATSVLTVLHLYPLYFVNTIIGNASNTFLTVEHLTSQLKELFSSFYPILLFLIFALGHRAFENRMRGFQSEGAWVDFSIWSRPLFGRPLSFLLYSFLFSLLAFLFMLGPHTGSYLNYAFQLLVPTFFCWFFCEFGLAKKFNELFILVVLLNLFSWESKVLDPNKLKQKDSKEWARVSEYVRLSSTILNSPAVAAEVVTLGRIPMDSGQTSYFYTVEHFPDNLLTRTSYSEFYDDGLRYTLLIDHMIEKQRFDLVITTREKEAFYHEQILWDYYDVVDEIRVDMPQSNQQWTLVVWQPLIK